MVFIHIQAKEQNDYLSSGTTPTPNVQFAKETTLQEDNLGVSSTFHPPDLGVSPIKEISNPLPAVASTVNGNGNQRPACCPPSDCCHQVETPIEEEPCPPNSLVTQKVW